MDYKFRVWLEFKSSKRKNVNLYWQSDLLCCHSHGDSVSGMGGVCERVRSHNVNIPKAVFGGKLWMGLRWAHKRRRAEPYGGSRYQDIMETQPVRSTQGKVLHHCRDMWPCTVAHTRHSHAYARTHTWVHTVWKEKGKLLKTMALVTVSDRVFMMSQCSLYYEWKIKLFN